MHKRIAVDLAKFVYQVAESVRVGHVSQRKRLNRTQFAQYWKRFAHYLWGESIYLVRVHSVFYVS